MRLPRSESVAAWDRSAVPPEVSGAGTDVASPASPPSAPVPAIPPVRVSRVGTLILFVGVALLGVAYLVFGWYYYSLVYGAIAVASFQQTLLWETVTYFLTAIGAVLAGIGWGLDQRAARRSFGGGSVDASRVQRLVGYVLVGVGVACFAGAQTFLALIVAAEYLSSAVFENLPLWTLPAIEFSTGVGVLAVAVGWLLHHWAVLADRERAASGA